MRKKLLSGVLPFVLAVSMFAGCGSSTTDNASTTEKKDSDVAEKNDQKDGAEESEQKDGAEKSEQKDATEENKQKDTAEEPVEITFFHMFSEEGICGWIEERTDAFMKENPNIKVNLEIVSADSYSQNLQTKIASDDAPNIMVANTGKSFLAQYSDAGHLADLSDIENLENISDIILPDGQIDGKQYGITLDSNAHGVFYNKDIFAKYGLEIPETLSEMDEVCATLEENDVQPFVTGYGQLWVIGSTLKIYEDILCGPEWYTRHENLESKFAGDEKFEQVMSNFMRYKKYWEDDPFGTVATDAYDAIANGEAAMTINGTWMIDAVEQRNPDCNLGFFAMPTSEDPAGAIVDLVPGSPLCVYNTDDAAKLDASKKYMSFLITEESCNLYATTAKKLSTCPNVDFSFSDCLLDVVKYPADRQFSMAGHVRFSDQYNTLQNEIVQKYAMMDEYDFDSLTAALDDAFTTAVQ